MKKNFKYYAIIWAVMFVLFNALTFIVTANTIGLDNATASFWFSYALIVITFVGQLVCAKEAFNGDVKKLFYNMPLLSVSYTGLIATVVIGLLCMLVNAIPSWIGACICLIVLAAVIIASIKAKAAADIIQNRDKQIKQKTSFIKNLTVEAETLMNTAKTEEEKKELKKLYEAVKYSDPMSCCELDDIEEQIQTAFRSLKNDCSQEKIQNLIGLISVRASKCKALK